MIVHPKVRGFICTTAHPAGCQAHVNEWISYVSGQPKLSGGPKRVLVIGASTGFGLASRISAAFGAQAETIGVFFEKPPAEKRTATAGWYNTVAFEQAAAERGLYAKSVNGDAFSDEIKQQVMEMIRNDWGGGVDLVVYSIASPRRTHPETGEVFNSVLKPIGAPFTNKTINVESAEVSEITINPATDEEIRQTVAVMGGDDWSRWIEVLLQAGLLAEGAKTVAYTYVGPACTHAIYRNGTIGQAKEHLEATAHVLDRLLSSSVKGRALISVNKGLVTQASSAIPVVPLYISLLYRVMKNKGLHEGCIQQMRRLFAERLYTADGVVPTDSAGRIRIDDWEMRDDVQAEVQVLWDQVTTDNMMQLSDLVGYREDFYHLFGFGFPDIDYDADVEVAVAIPSLSGVLAV